MSLGFGLAIFIVVWWLVFLAVLPWGVRSHHEADEKVAQGNERGAPTNPNLKRKLVITTLITLALWALTHAWFSVQA